jgi:DNA-binding NtrC family response regulator
MGKTRKMKVLIVDDEVEFTSTLVERLRLRNIVAEGVFSGEDSLGMITEYSPDVVILDLKLPGMSGLNVLSKIKDIDPTIEVILLTSHGSFEAGLSGMELGAFDYLIKPVDLTQLMEKIAEAYEKERGK